MGKKRWEGEPLDANQPVDAAGNEGAVEGAAEGSTAAEPGSDAVGSSEGQGEVTAVTEKPKGRVPVKLYLKAKGVPLHEQGGMVAYATKRKLTVGSVEQYDELFKSY